MSWQKEKRWRRFCGNDSSSSRSATARWGAKSGQRHAPPHARRRCEERCQDASCRNKEPSYEPITSCCCLSPFHSVAAAGGDTLDDEIHNRFLIPWGKRVMAFTFL